MLDALVNFAMMNVAFMVIVLIVGVYAIVRATTRKDEASAQVDARERVPMAPADAEPVGAHEAMDIHSRV
jgi:flagellar biosynthesis/type III secretory pathway M-ring protein FliF/YscJ